MSRQAGVPHLHVSSSREPVNPARSVAAAVAVLAVSSIYCVFPLLTHQAIPMGHDTVFHIFQADQLHQGIRNGLLYPRWVADANNGYGSPNFIFYAPLAYYLVFLVNIWEPSMIMSMVYVIWAGFFLSGLTMLYAARRMFGKRGSLLAAVIYQLLPFHLIDLYHRGTFAELLAYSWLPLFFYFLVKSKDSEDSRVPMAGLAMTYATVILTHLAVGFLFSIVAGVYLFYVFIVRTEKMSLIRTLISLLFGLGISSVYLVPAAWERKYVHIDVLLKYQWAGNFLPDFRSGILHEIFYRLLNITFCLEIGIFLLTLLLYKRLAKKSDEKYFSSYLILLFVLATFLVVPFSKPVWSLIPQFHMLAFPWRWIIVMEPSLCFLIASTFSGEELSHARHGRMVKIFLLALIVSFAQFPMQNIHDVAISESDLVRLKRMDQWKNIMDEKYEYLPIWAPEPDMEKAFLRIHHERVAIISGRASVRVTEWAPESRAIEVRALSDAVIRISTFYYPGWRVTRDGEPVPLDIERGSGLLLVHVPSGAHTILASFGDTRLRRISKYASAGSLLLLIPVTMVFGGSNRSRGRRPIR